MQINAISSNYYADNKNQKQLNFKKLITDKSALQIVNNMSKTDCKEFNNLKKRLSKTKYWDMSISGIGEKFKNFAVKFINRNKKQVITDSIYPYAKKDNKISIYSIVYGDENISQNVVEDLQFKSKKRANKIYDKYNKNLEDILNRRFNLRPIEVLKSKEIELNMLEESARTTHQKEKISFVSTDIKTKDFIGNDFEY